ncbi:MAG: hypothetical protein ABEI77_10795 [Halorientalis sp.]
MEVWDTDIPADAVPEGVSADQLDERVRDEYGYGTVQVDQDGEFSVPLPAGVDEVEVRIFDDGAFLTATDCVVPEDGRLVFEVADDGGVDWRLPVAGGGAVLAALAGYWALTHGNGGPGPNNSTAKKGTQGPTSGTQADFQPNLDAPNDSGAGVRLPGQQGKFLYDGSDPVQTGVEDDAIDEATATILRGKITTREGEPLSGVTVGVQDHPEFGRTQTRDSGLFDMVVSGGSKYVVAAEKDGYLPVQRTRDVPARDYVWVDELAMVSAGGKQTTVQMSASTPQVHQSEPVKDEDGERQTTLFFPPRTAASTGNDGRGRPTELTVSATEYTVGENGPDAMPGELPTGTGYTYAAEFTAETNSSGQSGDGSGSGLTRPLLADAKGDVEFSSPIILYLENFLGFEVGGQVPTGALRRESGTWEAAADGRVVSVLGTDNGKAQLDIDGSSSAASASQLRRLGVTDAEREHVASSYESGQTLWRVPIAHFSPWDCNWPYAPDNDDPPSQSNRGAGSGC